MFLSHQCGTEAASRVSLRTDRSDSGRSQYAISTVASASFAGSPWADCSMRSCSASSISCPRSEELLQQTRFIRSEFANLFYVCQSEVRMVLFAVFEPIRRRWRFQLEKG